MEKVVDKSIELVVCVGLVGIGLAVGGPLMAGAVSGLGVNMLSPHAEHGSRFFRRRLLGPPAAVNADLEKSLQRAYVDAAGRLEERWWTGNPRGHQLKQLKDKRQSDPQALVDYEAAQGFFDGLRESAARVFEHGRLATLAKEPAMLRLLDAGDAEIGSAVASVLTSALRGHDPQLVDFVRANLVDELAFCFTADLKTDATEQNRAWRGYQKLLLDGMTDTLGQIKTEQSEWSAAAAKLTAWATALETTPVAARDPIGESGLADLLTDLETRLNRAIERDGERTRATVREVGEQTGTAVWEVGELVVDVVEEGQRQVSAQIELLHQAVRQVGPDVRDRSDAATPLRAPGSLPPIWNVPYDRNPAFWPRPSVMDALAQTPEGDQPGVLVKALHGLGGVGKTQLAVAHAYRHAADYDLVWWVRAETPDVLAADYAGLAGELALPEADLADQATVVAAVRRHLGQTTTRWLLVFDNAEQVADLKAYLPQGGSGRVIVTSRNPVWSGVATASKVEVLAPEDAAAFLTDRTGQDDHASASAIAGEMGCLPLALDQARAYIEETDISLERYLALYRFNRSALNAKGSVDTGYAETVATTWEISFRRLSERSPAGAMLLTLCAFLAPDAIPLEVIAAQAAHLPPELGAVVGDDLELTEAVGAALRFSLIQRIDDRTLAMHRLVQDAARVRLSKAERATWATTAVELLNAAFPDDSEDVAQWPACARLLSHGLAAIVRADEIRVMPPGLPRMLGGVGLYFTGRGELAVARPLLERAMAIREATLPPGHLDIAISLNDLALSLLARSELVAARSLLEQALAIREAALPPGHPDIATSLNNLALTLHYLGELAAARSLDERALAIREAALPPGHPDIATSLDNLGVTFQRLGELAAARSLHERALAIREAALPPGHPNIALSLNNLATTLAQLDELAAARPMFERSLAISEVALPPGHPGIARALHNLAVTLRNLGEPAAARPLHERAVAIYQAALPPGHPDIANGLDHLARTVKMLGNPTAARSLHERALRLHQAGGRRRPEAKGFFGLGEVALALGRPMEALRLRIVCAVIEREIGHHDLEKDLEAVRTLAATEGIDEERLALLSKEAESAYRADAGWGMIRLAFPEGEEEETKSGDKTVSEPVKAL